MICVLRIIYMLTFLQMELNVCKYTNIFVFFSSFREFHSFCSQIRLHTLNGITGLA